MNRSLLQRLSTFFYVRPRLLLAVLLGPPLLWLGVVYLGSLFAFVAQSFLRFDDFSGQVLNEFSLGAYQNLFTPENVDIFQRTTGMALAVTLAAALLAFPLAYFMARYATGRLKGFLYIAVLLPLWSSYLVRVYAWKLILAREGIISWFAGLFGMQGAIDWVLSNPTLGGSSLSQSFIGTFLVFLYIWLPYMILPVNAALERVPKSLIEAASDLGARPLQSFRDVVFPLAFPGIVAGSIFTFSLTLGDYIIPAIIGNSSLFIGQAVLRHQGTGGNIPLAAAMTLVPMLIMMVYLLVARKMGAFDAL